MARDGSPHTAASNAPTLLITGGLGFIFSYVTEHFVKKGWRVIVIDNVSEGSHPEIIDGSFTHIDAHMANESVVDLIVKESPDYLIHAAAMTDVDYSVREPYRTLYKNALGTFHAFEAARRLPHLKKFLYVATDEIYGSRETPAFEYETLMATNPYSSSKAIGSLVGLAYGNSYPELREKLVEVRPCNAFGPRQDARKILPQIKKAITEGYSIPLHEEGKGYREYLYVKNIPPAIELLLERGHGPYNLTSGDGYTVKELIENVEAISGKKIPTHPARRSGMDLRYTVDGSRIRELGWEPSYTFAEGLADYLGFPEDVRHAISRGEREAARFSWRRLARRVLAAIAGRG